MNCNECNIVNIPLAAHQSMLAREDKKNARLIMVVVFLIVALVATNIAWLVTWNSYDFVSEDYDFSQDGTGINIIGEQNEAQQHVTETPYTP